MNAHISMIDAIRNGVKPREHAPCPFCGEEPGLARQVAQSRFIVGCESDDCFICPQVSGETVSEAWARWNKRAPVLTVVARNSDETLAGAGGIK